MGILDPTQHPFCKNHGQNNAGKSTLSLYCIIDIVKNTPIFTTSIEVAGLSATPFTIFTRLRKVCPNYLEWVGYLQTAAVWDNILMS